MRALVSIFVIISTVTASYCTVNDHSVDITALPYAASDIHPCQYAGTINVASEKDVEHNLFYWFFRNTNTSAPLIVWINGGPGSTSMFGLFIENGPMRVVRNGTTMDDFQIVKAEKAWTDDYNVLYIDQPANVGFSWGTSYVDNEQDASNEFGTFLVKFFEQYPENNEMPFWLTGESYAGKYLPLYTHDIIEYNKKVNATEKLNIRGTLIGDPYSSPVLQRTQIHRVPEALGILDDMNLDQIALLEQKCLEEQAINLTATADKCGAIMDYVETISDNVLPYNSRIFDYDFDPKEQVVKDIFTQSTKVDQIYKSLHVENSTKVPKFMFGNEEVYNHLADKTMQDYSYYYNYLIHRQYPLLIMAGEFDMQDGASGMPAWMKQTLTELNSTFWTQERRIYTYDVSSNLNESTEIKNGGYWQNQEFYTLVTVPKSGHFIPTDNYDASKSYLDDFLIHGTLECKYLPCSTTPQQCAMLSGCFETEGFGKCGANGQCECNAGYKGSDCAYNALSPSRTYYPDFSYSTLGSQWFYVSQNVTTDDSWTVTISSSNSPLNIYVSWGIDSNPNKFTHDMAFKGVGQTFVLSKDIIPNGSFTAAVQVDGYDAYNNMAIKGMVDVHYKS